MNTPKAVPQTPLKPMLKGREFQSFGTTAEALPHVATHLALDYRDTQSRDSEDVQTSEAGSYESTWLGILSMHHSSFAAQTQYLFF